MAINTRLAAELVKAVVVAPLRRLSTGGLRERVRLQLTKLLTVAHKTNPSGNNMSQR